MAVKPNKPTPNQQAWDKELRGIKSFINRASKRGFRFDTSILPEKPKRITKNKLQNLQDLTPNILYENAQYLNPNTGKIVTGLEGRTLERQKAAKKGEITKAIKKTKNLPMRSTAVLENIRQIIREWSPAPNWSKYWIEQKTRNKNKLELILEETILQDGEQQVAKRLEDNADRIERIVNSILYGSDEEQIQFDLVEFATILKGRPLTLSESADLTGIQETQEEQ